MVGVARVLGLLLLAWSVAVSAKTTASFDRNEIRINETVRLTIETDQSSVPPDIDLKELESQFRILNLSRGTNISIINGQRSLVHRWTAELAPQSVGSFSIGPITVSKEQTNRLRIAVLPEASEASGRKEVFIEVELDRDTSYVQQQVLITARLFISVRLLDGALADPEPPNTLVRRLGKDVRYEAERGGNKYNVFERRYALIPQQSGKLTIPPIQFEGLADDLAAPGNSVFNPLFSQGRRIFANAEALDLDVKPPPQSFAGEKWLPASQLMLQGNDEFSGQVTVGEPITRKLHLEGVGVTAEQLPDLLQTDIEGLQIYPDQSSLETVDTRDGLIGKLDKSIALIATRAGEFILPPIVVPWWNTETDKMERAELPAITLIVAPNSAIQPSIQIDQPEDEGRDDSRTGAVSAATAPEEAASRSIWKWIAFALLVLWLATMAQLLRLIQRQPKSLGPGSVHVIEPDKSMARWYTSARDACGGNRPEAARIALLGWGRVRYGSVQGLSDLGRQMGIAMHPEQARQLQRELALLDQTLYSVEAGDDPAQNAAERGWNGGNLWRLFKNGSAESVPAAASMAALPPLYPAA